MAKTDLGATAERLFTGFMAPLVLGGPLAPGRPIGGRAALALGIERSVIDTDLLAHTELARVRVARKLAPVDRFEPPLPDEWALATCLHDIVQSTHPNLAGLFRRAKTPTKLLEIVQSTLERIAPPATSHQALSRHTWFSRVFELARTDTRVSWWTGSRTYLGEDPPTRLAAWPELRRVHIDKTPRPLTELVGAGSGAVVPRDLFFSVLSTWLTRTPLTDLATLHRAEPAFAWTAETLHLVATRSGRTLTTRALGHLDEEASSVALGRATERLFGAQAWAAAAVAMDLLGDLALASAERAGDSGVPLRGAEAASFARATGALVAARALRGSKSLFAEAQRTRLLSALTPWLESDAAQRIRTTVEGVPLVR